MLSITINTLEAMDRLVALGLGQVNAKVNGQCLLLGVKPVKVKEFCPLSHHIHVGPYFTMPL